MFERLARWLKLSAIPQVFMVAVALVIVFVSVASPFGDGVAHVTFHQSTPDGC